jgi:hypothetical protein
VRRVGGRFSPIIVPIIRLVKGIGFGWMPKCEMLNDKEINKINNLKTKLY